MEEIPLRSFSDHFQQNLLPVAAQSIDEIETS